MSLEYEDSSSPPCIDFILAAQKIVSLLTSTTPETCYFQIGEAKYGQTPCSTECSFRALPSPRRPSAALVSIDSTHKSNVSVGLPIDLVVYKEERCAATRWYHR